MTEQDIHVGYLQESRVGVHCLRGAPALSRKSDNHLLRFGQDFSWRILSRFEAVLKKADMPATIGPTDQRAESDATNGSAVNKTFSLETLNECQMIAF